MTSTNSSTWLSTPTSEVGSYAAAPGMTDPLSTTHPLLERSDEELAQQARAGSRPAFEALVRRFEPRLMAFLLTRCRTRDDAEDAFQQTFAAVWTCLHQYDPSRPPAPWLFTIAARIAMKEAKRNDRRRRRERIVARDEKWSSTSDAMIPPEAGAGNIWTIAARSLSQDSYSALWLRYAEEMEPAQIAAVLGKRSGAVRVMLHRARLRLLELVEQDQGVDLRRTTAMEAAS